MVNFNAVKEMAVDEVIVEANSGCLAHEIRVARSSRQFLATLEISLSR